LFIILCLTVSCSQVKYNQQLNIEKQSFANTININSATVEEIERLPKIGKGLAKNIIEHRQRYGKFHKIEHLILVKKMSDAKFREIQNLVTAE
jgi:competence protein ComEA